MGLLNAQEVEKQYYAENVSDKELISLGKGSVISFPDIVGYRAKDG